jgi:hypothetical protein
MTTQIQHRRDTLANWLAVNPVLSQGEPAYETDTGRSKIGDGIQAYSAVPYLVGTGGGGGGGDDQFAGSVRVHDLG